MKYAIIITAHTNPKQLKRLCATLINDDCYFIVHIDKKSNLQDFENELKDIPNLYIISDYKVYWGDISQVDATIALLKKGLSLEVNYFFFISGVDYLIPIDNNLMKYIDPKKNYMEFEQLPYYKWGEEGRCDRYKYYHNIINNIFWFKINPRNTIYYKFSRYMVKLQKILKINRKFIKNHKPYSGANWININRECAEYIVNNYKNYRKYFKYVYLPDEMVIQTIVMNSRLKDTVINETLRYIDWFTGPDEPRTLTVEDYDKIIKSGKLFCRKTDENRYEELLNMLDNRRKIR